MKITTLCRCGECSAMFRDHDRKFTLREYREKQPEESNRFEYCSHGRDNNRGPYYAGELAHPIRTPWFVYLYGAQS